MPQVIKGMSAEYTPTTIGLLTMIPWIAASVALVANGWHSDRSGDQVLHVALPAVVGGISFLALPSMGSPAATLVTLSVATACTIAVFAP